MGGCIRAGGGGDGAQPLSSQMTGTQQDWSRNSLGQLPPAVFHFVFKEMNLIHFRIENKHDTSAL